MLRFVPFGIFLTLPAFAAEQPRIAVVGMHQADLGAEGQARTVEQLVQALESTGKFDALTPGEVAGAIRGREGVILEEGLLSSAREKLATGKGQYNQANPDDAIVTLQAAIDELERAMAATNQVDDLWEARVYVGTSHLQREDPDEAAAAEAFRGALAVAPDRPLSAALFPPYVVEAYEAERSALAATPTTLEVTADGPATVWVDGIERGPAPVKVEGLYPGTHYVVARGEGTHGYQRVVIEAPPAPEAPPEEAEEDAAEEGAEPPPAPAPPAPKAVALTMTHPTLGEAASSPTGRSLQMGAMYNALGNRSEGIDYFLVVGVEGPQLHLQLLSATTDTFSKGLEIPYADTADDEAAQTVPLLLNLVDKQGGFTASSGTAVPLDVGANSELALLLTQPRTPVPIGGPGGGEGTAKKGKAGVVVGVTTAILAAGAASAGVYLFTRPDEVDPNQGSIVIQF